MNRRDFLTFLCGAPIAAALLARLPQAVAVASSADAWQATYAAAHGEAWRILCKAMHDYGYNTPVALPVCFGGRFPDGRVYKHQFSVSTLAEPPDREGTLRLRPAMYALAQRAATEGLGQFAELSLPTGLEYAGNRGPLRMIVQYDLATNQPLVRFDIGGARSEQGERLARRLRQRELVSRLRRLPEPRLNPKRLPA